ncbi:MAG TPA: efflux RND transporter periplasmic adaptor subunit [Vicinamibacterales bacterium]|nr:efflux RND transporter periplasmic adaptor subunit [Vicinamibacterales bacterium]
MTHVIKNKTGGETAMTSNTRQRKYWTAAGILLAALVVGAVAGGRGKAATPAAPPPPPAVSVLAVAGEDVATYRDYPARTYARDLVEVRGRVDGYIDRRSFEIGSDVRAGQVLFVLDVRPYEAEVERARGALAQATADIAQAEAALLKSRQDVERLAPLVEEEAAPRQDLDNAVAARQAAEAAVTSRKATLEANRAILRTAALNLEYATIRAPISGRIGDSLLQVGGLVTKASPQPLTTIVPLDPVWVRFQVSEAELPLFQRGAAGTLPIELALNDSKGPTRQGRIENTLNSVNTRTGTLEVQATFRNADHAILPGQFVRVRVRTAERRHALLVPQRAVQDLQGQRSVLTVGADGVVQERSVVTGDRIEQRWIVEQGLKAGDTVVVDGLQKVRPGSRVTPRPAGDAASSNGR